MLYRDSDCAANPSHVNSPSQSLRSTDVKVFNLMAVLAALPELRESPIPV